MKQNYQKNLQRHPIEKRKDMKLKWWTNIYTMISKRTKLRWNKRTYLTYNSSLRNSHFQPIGRGSETTKGLSFPSNQKCFSLSLETENYQHKTITPKEIGKWLLIREISKKKKKFELKVLLEVGRSSLFCLGAERLFLGYEWAL